MLKCYFSLKIVAPTKPSYFSRNVGLFTNLILTIVTFGYTTKTAERYSITKKSMPNNMSINKMIYFEM